MPTFIKNAGGGGEQINAAVQVKVLAADSIQIGDTVYTVDKAGDIRGDLTFMGLDSDVNAAVFSPDGNLLVLGGDFTGRAKVYSVSGTTVTYVSDIYADTAGTALSGVVVTAAFSPDGGTLVLGGVFTSGAKVYSVSGATVTYVSNLYADTAGTALSGRVSTAAFAQDGGTLVLGGGFNGRAKVYSVSGTTVTFVSDVYADAGDIHIAAPVYTAAFSPDGNLLVLGGDFTGRAKVYSVSGTAVTFVSDIYADTAGTALIGVVVTAAFSPDGGTLVLGGVFTSGAKVYSVSGATVTFVSDIYADTAGTALSGVVVTAAFSPDGGTLVLGGGFNGRAKVYSVSGTTVTFAGDIYADAGTTKLDDLVAAAMFSPDGGTLVLGGGFNGRAKVYSVSGTTATYVGYLYADAGTTELDGNVAAAVFSPDGNLLALVGYFSARAKVFSVNGTTITFVSDVYADAGDIHIAAPVYTAAFSPDGNLLVLGGDFTGRAKVYSVSGTTVTFAGDIYADAGTTALSGWVYTAAFSPDGATLVLGGDFTGRAKVYSVSGTTVTYVSDLYADAAGTALDKWVNTAAFAPDGGTLVLGGYVTGRAKVYSVSGTTVTYVGNLYADAAGTALYDEVNAAVFSPDGGTLVLGGDFNGSAKVYSVSGTTVTFVSNIYADAGTTELDGNVAAVAFSPDGTTLVLGGGFTGHAKVYLVSGTAVTFVSDIYANTGTTALDSDVRTAAFSPDGAMLVLGGNFAGCSKWYTVLQDRIVYALAYLAQGGNIPEGVNHVGVGFAKSAMAAEETGTVKLIGRIG